MGKYQNGIGVDYYLTLEKDGNELLIKKRKIDQPQQVISLLERIDEFDDVLKLQKIANNNHLQKNVVYHYCWPNEYGSSYVKCAEFPDIDERQYKKDLNDIKISITKEFTRRYRKDVINKGAELQKAIIEEQNEYKENVLNQYKNDLRRYLYAQCYSNVLPKVKEKALMYSSEALGWYKPDYKIADDIQISLRTNFCYGSASYFYVNLKYKGINILPYSDLVTYFYSNMMDNVRYTKDYWPRRSNWEHALLFVKEISDMITTDYKNFEKVWIINEVEEMMAGLKTINDDIDKYYETQKNKFDEEREKTKEDRKEPLIVYRNINEKEINRYNIYKYEQSLVTRTDKLSAALGFLSDLTSLKTIYEPVLKHIETILRYNEKLLNPIQECLESIAAKLLVLNKEKTTLECEIRKLEKDLQERKAEISKEIDEQEKYEELKEMADFFRHIEIDKACDNDEIYRKIKADLNGVKNEHQKVETDIKERERFEEHLAAKLDFISSKLEEFES